MNLRHVLFISLIFYFSGCIPEENANSTIKISFSNFLLENTVSSWVIVHDLNGKVVKFSQIQNGEVNLRDIDPGTRYHLSFFRQYSGSSSPPFHIQTILDVPFTEDIYYRPQTQNGPAPTVFLDGRIKAVVTHDEGMSDIFLSSESGRVSRVRNSKGTVAEVEMKFAPSETSYFLGVTSRSGESRYQIIDSAQKDHTYHYNFSDLKEYDKYLTISSNPLENILYFVTGYKLAEDLGKAGFQIGFRQTFFNLYPPHVIKIGYLEQDFPYSTTIYGTLKQSSVSYQFTKTGPAPTQIPVPTNVDIDLPKKSIADFLYNNKHDGSYWEATWLMRTNDVATSTVWNIWGEMSAFKIHEMPNELIAINSNFEDISAFEPSSFVVVQNSLSFAELFRYRYIETDVEFPYYEEVKIGLSIQ